jgi:tetratricopeptide (TPR) repeat protein
MILLRALRKEPQERYATIEQFAEDLENYLESRPIRARTGDAWYRTRKFVRRYWLPVAAITLAVAGPSIGVVVANRQRAIAQRRFAQVRQVANKLFDIEAEVRRTPGTTKARELIIATSLDYLQRLAADAHGDPELAWELADAYVSVAHVQGVPNDFNLGHIDQADKSLQVAERLVRSVLSAQPANRAAVLRLARISHDRMVLAQLRRDYPETLRLAGNTMTLLGTYESTGKVGPSETDQVITLYMNVGTRYAFFDRFDDAIRLASRARDLARTAGLSNRVGAALWSLANTYGRKGGFEQALVAIREAVRLLEPPPDNTKPARILTYASALVTEGEILGDNRGFNLGRPEEALVPLQRAYEILDELAGRDANDNESRNRLFSATEPMADIIADRDPIRALAIYDHTLSRLADLPRNAAARRKEAWTLANSAYPLRRMGRNTEVRRRLDRALAQLKELKLYPGEALTPEVCDTLFALADLEAATGNEPRAIAIYQELQQKIQAATPKVETSGEASQNVSRIYQAMAQIHRRNRRFDLASEWDLRRRDLWRSWEARIPNNAFVRRQLSELGR